MTTVARRSTLRVALLCVAALFALPAGTAFAGNLMATGHDADYHCSVLGGQCGFMEVAVNFVRSGAPDPSKPVLVLEHDAGSGSTVADSLDLAFGTGVVPRTVVDPRTGFAGTTLSTNLYSAIIVASDTTCGGCSNNEPSSTPDSDAINARAGDIAAFFNDGGGVLALSGASHGDGNPNTGADTYYSFLPITVGGQQVTPPFRLTAEGQTLGFQDASNGIGTRDDINCCATHNSFSEPAGGSVLRVAERDANGFPETIFAGGTIIGGRIFSLSLSPPSASNPIGTPHVVTATLSDQNGPAGGLPIRFVVGGANSVSGAVGTDGAGRASFAYIGGTAGNDTITACYDANGNGGCDGGEPRASATKTWSPRVTTAALPPPVFLQSANLEPVSGTVRVKRRGSRRFARLQRGEQIPFGSVVDTRRGEVRLSTARGARGGVQTALFRAGIFLLTQKRDATTDLKLQGGSFRRCTTSARRNRSRNRARRAESSARRRSSRRVRRLFGNGSGRFRTTGRYSATLVRGTRWQTEDRCNGTLTKVLSGRVSVRDFKRRKTVSVRAPRSYLAKATGSSSKRNRARRR